MRHWEDAVFARLLLDRGIVSRKLLDGVPQDREETLSAYLVRTGRLPEARAARLRGEALELPLVCLDCGRESILLRCISSDDLLCPVCGGVPLLRTEPVRSLLTPRARWARMVPVALLGGLIAILTIAVLNTPVPKTSYAPRDLAFKDELREIPEEVLQDVTEELKRFDFPGAKSRLLELLESDNPAIAEAARIFIAETDAEVTRAEQSFGELEAGYQVFLEEAEGILDSLDERSREDEGEDGPVVTLSPGSLDDARGFFRHFLFPESNLGLETIRARAGKGLTTERRVRLKYIARAEERLSIADKFLILPMALFWADTAEELLLGFPDLDVAAVTYRRAQVQARLEEKRSAHERSVDDGLMWLLDLSKRKPSPGARDATRELPVPGTADILRRIEAVRGPVLEEAGRLLTLVPESAPKEGPGRSGAREVDFPELEWAVYEVTNRQYAAFVAATERAPPLHWRGGKIPSGKEEHPVVYVSYEDSKAFCQWVGGRIPTEEEWKWAARGRESNHEYPWGENWDATRANWGGDGTMPVGSYPRGECRDGIQDLGGNVWEWVIRPNGRPGIKGGAWGLREDSYANAAKVRRPALAKDSGKGANNIGIRVVFDRNG